MKIWDFQWKFEIYNENLKFEIFDENFRFLKKIRIIRKFGNILYIESELIFFFENKIKIRQHIANSYFKNYFSKKYW